jgi:hypothetical protein
VSESRLAQRQCDGANDGAAGLIQSQTIKLAEPHIRTADDLQPSAERTAYQLTPVRHCCERDLAQSTRLQAIQRPPGDGCRVLMSPCISGLIRQRSWPTSAARQGLTRAEQHRNRLLGRRSRFCVAMIERDQDIRLWIIGRDRALCDIVSNCSQIAHDTLARVRSGIRHYISTTSPCFKPLLARSRSLTSTTSQQPAMPR